MPLELKFSSRGVSTRLGFDGVDKIYKHPFFEIINWEILNAGDYDAPSKPSLKNHAIEDQFGVARPAIKLFEVAARHQVHLPGFFLIQPELEQEQIEPILDDVYANLQNRINTWLAAENYAIGDVTVRNNRIYCNMPGCRCDYGIIRQSNRCLKWHNIKRHMQIKHPH